MTPLLALALDWQAHGYTPLPTATDGTKAPGIPWKRYVDTPATESDVRHDFRRDTDGLGLLCGLPSGQFEMFEVEGRAISLVPQLATLMGDNGLGHIWERVNAGYVEASPSGGIHWHYRVSDGLARANTKLASRLATPAELAAKPDEKRKVLIETRGQGGFTIIAPSAGRTHPTGKPWVVMLGSVDTIPTLTADERDALYAVAGMLDQIPTVDAPARTGRSANSGTRPGDEFNARAQWEDILVGWTKAQRPIIGNCYGWTRPGKKPRDGISATTTLNAGDNLYVFSTSTQFETETPYSKFAAYTLLKHHGDYSAAAKTLARAGYGTQPGHDVTPDAPFGQVGNLATVTPLPARPVAVVAERTLTYSDDANALALIDRFGHVLRHCSDRGRWYGWDGTTWAQCPATSGVAREYAKRIARALPETDTAATAHKKRSLSAPGISAMLMQAATDTRVSLTYDQLDAHPWELNTPAGIVDLRTGNLSPPDPAKLHTRVTSCAPDPAADTTAWVAFLSDTFAGDTATIAYLQRLIGYSAIGVIGPHILPFAIGSGGNGKGVFLEALARVLGGYATTAPAGFLMAKAYAGHETEIARLAGARMVLCSEINEEDHFDEAKIKQLTGGDTLTARFMHQDHFTFTPTHQLWLMGNHRPTVKSGGHSFWRRLRLIEFNHEVPEEKIIDDLQGILATDHGPALLSWIIAGAVAYHQGGLAEPVSVQVATENYAHDQDTVARFLEDVCHLGGGEYVQIKASIVRAAYEQWCLEAGETPVSAKVLGGSLAKAGVGTRAAHSGRLYLGITVLNQDTQSVALDDPGSGWPQ